MISAQMKKRSDEFLKMANAAEAGDDDQQHAAEKLVASEKAKLIKLSNKQKHVMNALFGRRAKRKNHPAEQEELRKLAIQTAASKQIIEAMDGVDGSPEKALGKATQAAFIDMLQQAEGDTKGYLVRTNKIKAQIENLSQELDDILEAAAHTARLSDINGAYCKRLVKIYEAAFGPVDITGHTCESDDEAKQRFVVGIPEGIRNTPAFQSLLDHA